MAPLSHPLGSQYVLSLTFHIHLQLTECRSTADMSFTSTVFVLWNWWNQQFECLHKQMKLLLENKDQCSLAAGGCMTACVGTFQLF